MVKKTDMKTLGGRLRACRLAKGIPQLAVAKAVGLRQSSLSDLENDLYPTSTYTLRLATYYGVNPIWLESGKGNMQPEPVDQATMEIMQIYGQLDDNMRLILLEQARALSKINNK